MPSDDLSATRRDFLTAAAAIALIATGPATAEPRAQGRPFAILKAQPTVSVDAATRAAIVARADAALKRPPAPIPRLHTEGTLPGHGIRDISIAAKADHPIALDLAMAWRLTRQRAYLDQAARYLLAWAGVYRTSFNPIDETGFDALILATDLIAADVPAATRVRLDAFWRRMAVGYLDAMDGTPKHAITNWQSHRIKLATMAAYRTGDRRLIARARDAYRKQVANNLRADGSTFDFEERDALHYVTYNLEPLLTAVLAARAHGDDWLRYAAPSGASLPRTLNWFAAYARGEKTHVEFANSRIAFDRERAASGQKEFAPHEWEPEKALNTYALAAALDPRFAGIRDTLAARSKRAAPPWIAFLRR